MHSFTRFSGLRFLYQEEMLVDGEEWWKRRGGPPAWNGADPDGWAGLPGPRPAQKLLLPADALAPAWGCGASFPGRPEQQAAAVPRWSKAEDYALGDTQRWVPKLRHSGSELWG